MKKHTTSTHIMETTTMNSNTNNSNNMGNNAMDSNTNNFNNMENNNMSSNANNSNNDMETTTMNSNTNNTNNMETTAMNSNTANNEVVDRNEHAFRLKGKNSLEVNPGYFATKFVKKHGLVFFKGEGWFEWTKEGWAPLRKSILQSRIRDLLKEKVCSFRMPGASKSQTTIMPAYELVNTGNINEILRLMTIDCDRGDTLPQLDPDVIPLQNGVLRWNAKKQDFDFGKYSQKDLIFSRLGAVYDPKAESELFQKKLAEMKPPRNAS